MKATVRVELKDGVLDPQGVTIRNALVDMGYPEIGSVKSGRVFTLDVNAGDPSSARRRVEDMCRKLLANPVIERYTIEVIE